MQTFNYQIGPWSAQANVMQVDGSKLMAMIKVSGNGDLDEVTSQHTIVFDHQQGMDAIEETKILMNDLLNPRYLS